MENNNIKKIEITVDIISGNFLTNQFMHLVDCFESGKILGNPRQLKITLELTQDGDEIKLVDNFIHNLKSGLETDSDMFVKEVVSFIGIREIDSIKNTSIPFYIKPGIQTISNGQKYYLFSKLLEQLGYEVTTSDQMYVLTAKLK
jgi:hypothetical protein